MAHLAACTGHRFVRINNHEQTDLQEYLGSYVSDEQVCPAGVLRRSALLVYFDSRRLLKTAGASERVSLPQAFGLA